MTDYMKNVEQVAHDAVFLKGRLWTSIFDAWQTLEAMARTANYDVLEAAARDGTHLVRRCMQELLTLLYHVPGAISPLRDAAQLVLKDQEYGGSWCRRGGPGAFMMMARKWDRIAHQVGKHGGELHAVIFIDQREEGIQDDLGDLRRYLILCLAWGRARLEELEAQEREAEAAEYVKPAEREEDIPF